MDITELMIDDWVKPFGSHKGVYAKVTSIGSDVIELITTGGNPHHAIENTIEPILLTNEILEKNGFKQTDIKEWTYSDSFLIINIEWDVFPENVVCRIETAIHSINIVINYVHELQHALKLCGINKTIEL